MFQKILLPCDGSRHSDDAARIAGELSAAHGGVVHPMVAVEYRYVMGEDVPPEVAAVVCDRIRARAARALAEANVEVERAGGKTDGGSVVEAPPVEAILDAAEQGSYDVIVMGSRGVSLDQGHDRLVGSVAERVIHRTPCPVLLIRAES